MPGQNVMNYPYMCDQGEELQFADKIKMMNGQQQQRSTQSSITQKPGKAVAASGDPLSTILI